MLVERPGKGEPRRWALLTHGFGSCKEFKLLARISAGLADAGWGVVRFDFAGLGNSEGDFSQTSFHTQKADVRAIHRWMSQHQWTPQLLAGHSLGGATLLALGHEFPATHLVTLGSPSDGDHLVERLIYLQPALAHGEGEVKIAGKRRKITPYMLEVLRRTDLAPHVAQLRQSLLIIQPERDETVTPHHSALLHQWAPHSEVRILDGADHLFRQEQHMKQATQWILHWVA